MIAYLRPLVSLTVISLLAGCSWIALPGYETEHGCKGMPSDPVCMSALQVYEATNNVSMLAVSEDEQERLDNSEVVLSNKEKLTQNLNSNKGYSTSGYGQGSFVPPDAYRKPVPHLKSPIPIRTPAKVMRIWVAPWEDDKGDLNVPGFIYTEIENRRWTIGEPAPNTQFVFNPLTEDMSGSDQDGDE